MKCIFAIFLVLVIIYKLNKYNKKEYFFDKYIDKFFVINLDISEDRLRYIKKQCLTAKINIDRWPGVNGSKLNLKNLRNKNILDDSERKLLPGAIGCSLSHIKLWNHILTKGYTNVVILEDDCIVPRNFYEKFNDYIKQVPKNWDIIYLGASNINATKINKNVLKPNSITGTSTHNSGTYAMLINTKIIPLLLKSHLPIKDNIDQTMKNVLFKKMNVYIFNPPLILHNNNFDSQRRLLSNRSGKTTWSKFIQNKVVIN